MSPHEQKRIEGLAAIVRYNLRNRRVVFDGLTREVIPRDVLDWNATQIAADLEDELRRGTDVQMMRKYQRVSEL